MKKLKRLICLFRGHSWEAVYRRKYKVCGYCGKCVLYNRQGKVK